MEQPEQNEKAVLLIEKAKYLAEESILLYNDTSPLRLGILGIPVLGSFIDAILTSKGQKISYDRLLGFINELGAEINSIDKQMIDKEYLESEEFYDLLLKAFEASLKTRHKEKIKLFARILKSACINEIGETNPEYYIDILSELNIEEIIVAKKIYEFRTTKQDEYESLKKKIRKNKETMSKDHEILALTDLDIPKENYTFILLRLQRSGLLKEQVYSMRFGYDGGVYDITDILKKIMTIINNNSAIPLD